MRDVCRRVGNGKRVEEGRKGRRKGRREGVRNAVMLEQIKYQKIYIYIIIWNKRWKRVENYTREKDAYMYIGVRSFL